MSDADPIFSAIEAKFGKCVVHAISAPDLMGFLRGLPFNVRETPGGVAFDGVERLHIGAVEYNDGHVVLIGGRLTEEDHYSIYKTAHREKCDGRALIPFELKAGRSPGHPDNNLEAWSRAVRRLRSDGIAIASDGSLVQ